MILRLKMSRRLGLIVSGVILCSILVALPQWLQLRHTRTQLRTQAVASCVRSRTFEAFVRSAATARRSDSESASSTASYWLGLSRDTRINATFRNFILSDVALRNAQGTSDGKLSTYWFRLANVIHGATTCKADQVISLPTPPTP